MTKKGFLKFWMESAEDDFSVANDLFKLKRYNYCLFFCHLSIEKILKGLYYKKTQRQPPPTHDLKKLASETIDLLTEEYFKDFAEINTWNIRARYDDYKKIFYKKADKKFTELWMIKIKKIILWLKSQF